MLKLTKMTEIGAEIPLPAKQDVEEVNSPKKEPSLFRKLGSKLMQAGQIGLLSSVLITACDKAEKDSTPTEVFTTPAVIRTVENLPSEVPVIVETPQSENIMSFTESVSQIRGKIESAPSTPSRQEAFNSLENLEKTYDGISQLVEASDNKSENGIPVLVSQQKALFRDLDLKHLWQDKYENEEEFLKDLIFFYRDEKVLTRMSNDLARQNLSSEEMRVAINDVVNSTVINAENYRNIGTEGTRELIPVTQDGTLEKILPKLQQIPRLTEVKLKLDPQLRRGEFEDSTSTINFGPGMSEDVLLHLLQHELGHANDILATSVYFSENSQEQFLPNGNASILKNATATEAVNLYIARNELVLKTAQYGDTEKTYSPAYRSWLAKSSSGEELTPEETEASVSYYARSIITDPESRSPLKKQIFAGYLESPTLESQTTNAEPRTYNTLEEFLEGEAENLSLVEEENKLLAVVINKIKENPEIYKNYYPNNPNFKFTTTNIFRDIKNEFAPHILLSEWLNNTQTTNLVTKSEKEVLTNRIITVIQTVNREQMAEVFSNGQLQASQEYRNLIKQITTN